MTIPKGNGADVFSADIVAFLRAVSSGCSILIGALNISTNSSNPWFARFSPLSSCRRRISLRERFQFADIDLADEGRNILIVLVAGFCLAMATCEAAMEKPSRR